MTGFEIFVTLLGVGYIILAIGIDIKYLYRKYKHNYALRSIYYPVVILLPVLLLLILGKFTGFIETWRGFSLGVFFSMVVFAFFGGVQYLSLIYANWQLNRYINKQVSNMPDGSEKTQRKQDLRRFIENSYDEVIYGPLSPYPNPRIRRLREKIAKLPDGPQRTRLQQILESAENSDSSPSL
ncbi:MAG: hypothetical protein GY797_02220 [Deltaproteobacteria bacterium]|nr:hypothetical protein [Deltaproteobacteria bacterium]